PDAFNGRAWRKLFDVDTRIRNLYGHDLTPFYCSSSTPYGKIKSYSPVLDGTSTSGRSFSPRPATRVLNRYRPALKSLKVKRPNPFVSFVGKGPPAAVPNRPQAPGTGFLLASRTCPPICIHTSAVSGRPDWRYSVMRVVTIGPATSRNSSTGTVTIKYNTGFHR